MKILTISIAAYQVENYIRKAIESLIGESIIEYLEIFIIDDGGRDATLNIAKHYQNQYPNSIHVVHKENGGYGSTVNYSIKNATGKYFKLLDGDDWFDTSGLVGLVEYLKKHDDDLIITPVFKCIEGGETRIEKYQTLPENSTFTIGDLDKNIIFSMWAMTYRTDVLKQSNLLLPEHMLYTDQYYATIPLAHVKTISVYEKGVYCYRIGRDGQSISREARIKHLNDTKKISKDLMLYGVNLKESGNDNYNYISYRVAGVCARAARTILLKAVNATNLIELKEFDREVAFISQDIFDKQSVMGKTGRFLYFVRKSHYLLYWGIKLIPGGLPNWG